MQVRDLSPRNLLNQSRTSDENVACLPPSVDATRNHSLEEPYGADGDHLDSDVEMPEIKLRQNANNKYSTLSPVLESTPNFSVMGLPPFRSRHLISNISQSHNFRP